MHGGSQTYGCVRTPGAESRRNEIDETAMTTFFGAKALAAVKRGSMLLTFHLGEKAR